LTISKKPSAVAVFFNSSTKEASSYFSERLEEIFSIAGILSYP
jgi:hypothetical protein